MNIFKTFETFLKEPLSILRDNFIQIVSIQTNNIFENKPSCDVTVMKDKTQITVSFLRLTITAMPSSYSASMMSSTSATSRMEEGTLTLSSTSMFILW